MESLQAEVERIAPSCGGVFGLCALSLEHPDRHVSLNGAEPFPMWVPPTPATPVRLVSGPLSGDRKGAKKKRGGKEGIMKGEAFSLSACAVGHATAP